MDSILIKLSGEFLGKNGNFDCARIQDFVDQLKVLSKIYKIGLVIGGGNFFRASKNGEKLDMRQVTADSVGMIATIMNGLILQDFFERVAVKNVLLSAFEICSIIPKISQRLIDLALSEGKVIIFVGGTGNPFFTTDTSAVLRALQIGAKQVWKATKVDGVYSADPTLDKDAEKFKHINYAEYLERRLKVIDETAVTLAWKYDLKMRIFNIFDKQALLTASKDFDFGSTIG